MSNDPENEFFSDGIAEETINALTKIKALRVASRTFSFAFKGKNEDIGELGHKLKVHTVLKGSVRKAGNRLRVTAQLVNAADGYHLWSERYDRQLEDVFEIQDEIAQNIVRALRVVLGRTRSVRLRKRPCREPGQTPVATRHGLDLTTSIEDRRPGLGFLLLRRILEM
jgi:adenylate cyclase